MSRQDAVFALLTDMMKTEGPWTENPIYLNSAIVCGGENVNSQGVIMVTSKCKEGLVFLKLSRWEKDPKKIQFWIKTGAYFKRYAVLDHNPAIFA